MQSPGGGVNGRALVLVSCCIIVEASPGGGIAPGVRLVLPSLQVSAINYGCFSPGSSFPFLGSLRGGVVSWCFGASSLPGASIVPGVRLVGGAVCGRVASWVGVPGVVVFVCWSCLG